MIELRSFQGAWQDQVGAALRDGQNVLAVGPTGCGKRYCQVWWGLRAAKKHRRGLFVTDRQILVNKLREEFWENDMQVGCIMATEPRLDYAPVQVASLHTLRKRKFKPLDDISPIHYVMIDEAHKEPVGYQMLFERLNVPRVGWTATPLGPKSSNLVCDGFYDVMVEGPKKSWLIENGYLLPTVLYNPFSPDTKGVRLTAQGEFSPTASAKRVSECFVFADVFEWWQPYDWMKTLVFAPQLKYAYGLVEQFAAKGYCAEVLDGEHSIKEKARLIERFSNGSINPLISINCLGEGFDCPVAQCGIDLQPTHQYRNYWQKVGRVSRWAEGQAKCLWLDFAGNYYRFCHPDVDPEWSELWKGVPPKEAAARSAGKDDGPKEPWVCPRCAQGLSPWQKVHDGRCPNCGARMGKPKQHVKMGDGRMRQVAVDERKPLRKATRQSIWAKAFWMCANSGRPMKVARVIFRQETKKEFGVPLWPDHKTLKHCLEPRDPDWERTAYAIWPDLKKEREQC